MKKLKQVLIIINLKTVIVTVLEVASTYLCRRFDILAEFPMTLIARLRKLRRAGIPALPLSKIFIV